MHAMCLKVPDCRARSKSHTTPDTECVTILYTKKKKREKKKYTCMSFQ